MRRFFIYFCLLLIICMGNAPLFAATVTATNYGNIPAAIQYHTQNTEERQILELQPGQTQELPEGVQKVKMVRNPGEWAGDSEESKNAIILTIKEGEETLGVAGWSGDKIYFIKPTAQMGPGAPDIPVPPNQELPTQAPPQGGGGEKEAPKEPKTEEPPEDSIKPRTSLELTPAEGQSEAGKGASDSATRAAQGEEAVKPENLPEAVPESTSENQETQPGSITNRGYLSVQLVFSGPDQKTSTKTLQSGEKSDIPAGMTAVGFAEPAFMTGMGPGQQPVDLEIIKPSGEKASLRATTIDLNEKGIHFNFDWEVPAVVS